MEKNKKGTYEPADMKLVVSLSSYLFMVFTARAVNDMAVPWKKPVSVLGRKKVKVHLL